MYKQEVKQKGKQMLINEIFFDQNFKTLKRKRYLNRWEWRKMRIRKREIQTEQSN